MAKIIRIKSKGLRYTVSFVVLLIVIIAVIGAAIGISLGIGYGLDATGIDWFGKVTGIDDENKGIMYIFSAGMVTLCALYGLGAMGFGFFHGVKSISNKWFNSIGDKKEADEESKT